MKSCEIRQLFLDFFAKRGHAVVPSASLVPADDPTLLFTNAGMVPFKDYFLGKRSAPWPCAVSSQRCVRAGGKHNDLENVGVTARHHTFFEMLGFFSFGDYFKEKAITLAWSFLTEQLGLPQDKLWVTVHASDQEAADIWHKVIGVSRERIVFCGDADNFWAMGDTGPCGPCTEIFYDHGEAVAGGPPGSEDADGDRFVEIWNLVFMQYNRVDGALLPLPKPSVDTGMGLERIAAVMQGVHDNYDTDVFATLQQTIRDTYPDKTIEPLVTRVLSDHLRAMVFLMADQVLPSNEGRGYVLRRIMRRAMCYAHRSGLALPCLHGWVAPVATLMEAVYPGKLSEVKLIAARVEQEERRFAQTLTQGLEVLHASVGKDGLVSGELAFRLYDTYGLPLDVVLDWAALHGGKVDEAGFATSMAAQKKQSKQHQSFAAKSMMDDLVARSEFVGYQALVNKGTVQALVCDGQKVDALALGECGSVVLDQTVFYPEGGGQVGDHGQLIFDQGIFEVAATQKMGEAILHHGVCLQGKLTVGTVVQAAVDEARLQTQIHHSATHLLHAALRHCLGAHVLQRGSHVSKDRLRFDFTHDEALSVGCMQQLESWVNRAIRANVAVVPETMALDEAKKRGAMALFDEKYEAQVRVLRMGDFSIELCGGTHVSRTGDIGQFVILSNGAVASGVRRIEALAGAAAEAWYQAGIRQQHAMAQLMQCNVDQLLDRADAWHKTIKTLQQAQAKQSALGLHDRVDTWCEKAPMVNGIRIIAVLLDKKDSGQLRAIVDRIRQQQSNWVAMMVVQGNVGDKVPFVCAVSKAQATLLNAKKMADLFENAKCGGRDDFVQGAVPWHPSIKKMVDDLPNWVKKSI